MTVRAQPGRATIYAIDLSRSDRAGWMKMRLLAASMVSVVLCWRATGLPARGPTHDLPTEFVTIVGVSVAGGAASASR